MFSSLNQRAALQARVLQSDGGGGFAESWQTFAHAWVKIIPTGAADTAGPGKRESKARHRILLRRRADLSAGQLVIVGARIFKVQGVLDAGPQAPLATLLCEELPC